MAKPHRREYEHNREQNVDDCIPLCMSMGRETKEEMIKASQDLEMSVIFWSEM